MRTAKICFNPPPPFIEIEASLLFCFIIKAFISLQLCTLIYGAVKIKG